MRQNTIQLPDGRILSYAVHGAQEGWPVVYFHGTPSSRLEPLLPFIYGVDVYHLLQQHKLWLLAVDRPGMGRSTFHAQANFFSVADDVAYVLRQLNITRCSVLCWSGGAPFALALAHRFPRIINAVFIIAGFTIPFTKAHVFRLMGRNKLYFGAARQAPCFMRWIMNWFMKQEIKNSPPKSFTGLPDVDYRYLSNRRQYKHLAAITTQEACRYGARGAVHEAALYFRNFGFHLRQIQQPVYYWWGGEDKTVIRQHPKAVQQYAPQSKILFKPREGHLSIYIRYMGEVLHTIAAHAAGTPNNAAS